MPRILTKLRIDEVSSVDKGAGEGVKVMLYKRDSADDDTPLLFNDIMKAKAAADDDGVIDAGNGGATLPEKLEQLVAALIAADPSVTRQQAAYFILHSAHGRALYNALLKRRPIMDRSQELLSIAKAAGGMALICKNIIDRGSTTITEPEFSAALMAHAKVSRKAGESVVSAFSRILEQDDDVRRAYGIAKGYSDLATLEPTSVAVGDTDVQSDAKEAYDALAALAEKQHALAPTLSTAQLFARVFADPANANLAERARRYSCLS